VIYDRSPLAMIVFLAFVGLTLGLSFYFAGRAKSAAAYFSAGGEIHWFVNGVAFAGDYLSAASFLGICGMIAFYGYDGFLYSIGFLAGWIVALLVVAEPLKRLGRYTFADALNSRFQSPGIRLAAGVSALVVSVFYLIPQMVGAGALVKPLLGLSHTAGVMVVGGVVTLIVVTAGMVSTTYVQFLKGMLLVFFSGVLTVLILGRGLTATTDPTSLEPQTLRVVEGRRIVNGTPQGHGPGEGDFRPVGHVKSLPGGVASTGPVSPIGFLANLRGSEVILWGKKDEVVDGVKQTTFTPRVVPGEELFRPGNHPRLFKGLRGDDLYPKLNFLSLMLALFCGTASLPHILIRYYTVRDPAAARKSTVVGIGTIGTFYVLTLFLGLGAMTCGGIDVTDSNMAAPLLAKTFSTWLFAVISAVAFTTVLGTVSGLIVAAAGAVVHDLLGVLLRTPLEDHAKVRVAKIASVFVGIGAMALGIVFEKMNVNFLVGWAFSVAASANLPSLVMALFWKGTTKHGVIAAILVGMLSSLAWILASGDTFVDIYGLPADGALVPFSQPGIVTIPLGFVVLVVVSLLTREKPAAA
jgi:cation/acetate symporter